MARTLSTLAVLSLLGLSAATASAQNVVGRCTTTGATPGATGFGGYSAQPYNLNAGRNLYSAGGWNTSTTYGEPGTAICGPNGCVIPPPDNGGTPKPGGVRFPGGLDRVDGYRPHRGERGNYRYDGAYRDEGLFNPDLINRPDTYRVDRDLNFNGRHYYGDGHNHGVPPEHGVHSQFRVRQPLPAGGREPFPGNGPASRPLNIGFGADAGGVYY